MMESSSEVQPGLPSLRRISSARTIGLISFRSCPLEKSGMKRRPGFCLRRMSSIASQLNLPAKPKILSSLTSGRTVAATWSLAVSWTSIKYSFHNQRCHWAYESLEHVRGTIDFSDETSPFQSRTGNIELLGCPLHFCVETWAKIDIG